MKTIVITGSTRGIGRGLAEEFLVRGHQVVINGRDPGKVENVLSEFRSKGYRVEGVAGDVCSGGVFGALLEKGRVAFGGVDIWINNAGVPQSNRFFNELEEREIRQLAEVNITSLMLGTRIAINFFMEQGHGVVFNMEGFGSDGRMLDKLALYGTSKRAVNYFSRAVSREVSTRLKAKQGKATQGEVNSASLNQQPGNLPRGVQPVRVGIISPGMVRTEFLEHGSAEASPEEQKRNRKVFDILAEEVETVVPVLVEGMLNSHKAYDRVVFLTFRRLFPKILRLMFVKKK